MTYLIVGFCVAYGAFLIGGLHERIKISDRLTRLGESIRDDKWTIEVTGAEAIKHDGKIELYEYIRNNIV